MDARIKKQWLDALRSGQYEQARGGLAKQYYGGTRYCCLGVLCVILNIRKARLGDGRIEFDGSVSHLPASVVRKANLIETNPTLTLPNSDKIFSLAGLNDDGFTFQQIADLIDYFIPADEEVTT